MHAHSMSVFMLINLKQTLEDSPMKRKIFLAFISIFFSMNLYAYYTKSYNQKTFEVTVTNLTKGVLFTPLLGVTHDYRQTLFKTGEPASDSIIAVAEGGDISGLQSLFPADNTGSTDGLLEPGQSKSFTIKAHRYSVFSMVSMLLPTNDTMLAVRNKRLPFRSGKAIYYAKAYDAGSEANDELCANIPGPQCGGAAASPDDEGEGFIFPSAGIHGEGDLSRMQYNWNDPVAKIVIKRVN